MAPNRMRVTNCPHAPILFLSQLCQIALHGLGVLTFVALSVPLAANEPFLSKPSNEWTETEPLQVLNDRRGRTVSQRLRRILRATMSTLHIQVSFPKKWRR
jgi:hypothetical protein